MLSSQIWTESFLVVGPTKTYHSSPSLVFQTRENASFPQLSLLPTNFPWKQTDP